jgi:protease secretion system outer membrane protein
MDLITAYEAALSNDPIFRSAVKENEAGQLNREIGRSAIMPRVSGSYSQFANDSTITGPVFTGGPSATQNKIYPSDTSTVQLIQPLFNLEALAKMRQGQAQGNMSQAKFLFQSQDLLIRVLQTYSEVLYALDNHQFLVAQRDAYAEQIKVNQRSYEKGEGTLTDMLESKASYELAEVQVIEAGDVIENAKRKLEAITGQQLRSARDLKGLNKSFSVRPLVPLAFESWRDDALASNAELQAATHNVEVARQEYEKQSSGHYPIVSAVASWNQSKSAYTSAVNQNANTSSAGVQVSIPLFSGGEIAGRTSQARANYEKAQADRDAARDRLLTELRKQFDSVKSTAARVSALNRAVESSLELTKAMRKSVLGGQRINLDVLLADKALATAQRDLAQAKYNYMISLFKLKQLAGNLSLEDLEKIALHFEKNKR